MTQDCREEFEDWFDAPVSLERDEAGYKFMAAHSAWMAWRAAWNARSPSPELAENLRLREILREIATAFVEDNKLYKVELYEGLLTVCPHCDYQGDERPYHDEDCLVEKAKAALQQKEG